MSEKYKTEFSDEELQKALCAGESKAMEFIEDQGKWELFKKKIYGFLDKGRKIPVLGSVIDDMITMIELADAYVKKEYSDIPVGTIISVVAALIYLLNPFDLIPDVIPVIGYLDDAAVIMMVLHFGVDKDLDRFRKWKRERIEESIRLFQTEYAAGLSEVIGARYLAAVILEDSLDLKLVLCEKESAEDEIECIIKEMAVPLEILKEFHVETGEEILNVLEASIVSEDIKWVDGAERRIYLEPDFEENWDKYIILED